MPANFVKDGSSRVTPIYPLNKRQFIDWLSQCDSFQRQWVEATSFVADAMQICLLPNDDGGIAVVLFGVDDTLSCWSYAELTKQLPAGDYYFVEDCFANNEELYQASLAWGLAGYQFDAYKATSDTKTHLQLSEKIDQSLLADWVDSTALVRNLINTPACDMGPTQLAKAIETMAKPFSGQVTQIIGDDLLKQKFGAIHAVGKGCDDAPRLIELRWGKSTDRKVTLVGKGVCFDTGGLDIKNAAGMRIMKKDMAGSANVIGLARMIMAQKLPVNLRVLIPAVINAIDGNSMLPGDVLQMRNGLTVEVGNTDAEGRLVVADALALAVEDKPDLLIDLCTLTGAARIALGPEMPAFFANRDELVNQVLASAKKVQDPMWNLPLYQPYKQDLKSTVADICNISARPYAGAIMAALFLQHFVPDDIAWAHVDMSCWNFDDTAAKPYGGEALCIRALFDWLRHN